MTPSRHKYRRRIDNLGFANFLRYMAHKKTGLPRSGYFTLYSKYADGPLLCRAGTSDIDVFKHIFMLREYAGIGDLHEPRLIIDCGANAGYSTAYFLSVYPRAHVIAVEPDPGNFRMLERNTANFGDRCTRVQAGVWSESCGLRLVDAPNGDGREWARGVEVAGPGEAADIPAVAIDTLLAGSGYDRISLLKIDIEGAEQVVFGRDPLGWLDKVDCIAIELHGRDCEEAYRKAVDAAGFASVECGGLTLSRRAVAAGLPPGASA